MKTVRDSACPQEVDVLVRKPDMEERTCTELINGM